MNTQNHPVPFSYCSGRVLAGISLALAAALLSPPTTQAQTATTLPKGGEIVAGAGSISQSGNQMTVTQNTAKMVAQWDAFNIGQNASVQFDQPNVSSVALNRIQGQSPSQILGSLSANGQVFLVNPSGIYFGKNSTVNVGGIVASSLALKDEDFLAGKYAFAGSAASGSVSNAGNITAGRHGIVALISPVVSNEGAISAPLGGVALSAGNKINLDFNGDGLISLTVEEAALNAQSANQGLIKADGGMVIMSARAVGNLTQAVVNNSGVIEANTLTTINGRIILDGGEMGIVEQTGRLSATGMNAGETGGSIKITGEKVGLSGTALVDVSGQTGGGTALIGGGFHGEDSSINNAKRVFVGAETEIRANAIGSGKGGDVVVWSDEVTRFGGQLSARGGANQGDGGAVEISSKGSLGLSGGIDAGATNGNAGTLLLDPHDITIVSGAGVALTAADQFADTSASDVSIDPATITAATNVGTAVTLQANNDIVVNSSLVSLNIGANNGGKGGNLIFQAGRSIAVNSAIISDDGNVSFTVNDPNATADRSGGAASFTNIGLIDAGAGDVSITVGTNAGGSAGITGGKITANNLTIAHSGPTAGGAIDLGQTNLANNLTITSNSARNVTDFLDTVIVRNIADINSGGGDINISLATTDFNILRTNGGNVTILDTNAIQVGTTNATGTYTLTTKGPMASYLAEAMTIGGAASFTANNGGFGYADPYINFNNSNNFQSTVALNVATTGATATGGYAIIKDINALNLTAPGSPGINRYLTVTAGGAVDLGAVTIGTDLSLTTNGAITDSGTLVVPGNATFAAGSGNDITLDTASNNFGGLAFTSGRHVQFIDTNAVTLNSSAVTGNMTVTTGGAFNIAANATVTAAGAFTGNVTGAASVSGTNGNAEHLTFGSFDLTASGAVSFGWEADMTVNAGNATITAGGGVSFINGSDIVISAGNLDITAGGSITQVTNGRMTATGTTDFTVTAAGSSINLQSASNNFAGAITLSKSGVGTYTDVSLRNNSSAAGTISGLSGSLGSVLLYYDNAPSLMIPGMTLSGNLTVSAPLGSIGQSAALTVAGTTKVLAQATKDIDLGSVYTNDFTNMTVSSAKNVTIKDVNAINFDREVFLYNGGNLDVTAGGAITDTTNDNNYKFTFSGLGTATFNAGANPITLDDALNIWGTVVIPAATNVSLSAYQNIILGNIAVSGTFGVAGYNTGYTLTQVGGSSVVMPNNVTASFSNFSGGLTLTQPNNVLGNLALSNVGAINIRENDAITQASAWTTFNSTGSNTTRYTVGLTTSDDQAITLNQANYFGDVTITQMNNGAPSAGAVYVRETTDSMYGMTQGATPWVVHGTTKLDSGTNSITLTNVANILGPLQVTSLTGTTNVTVPVASSVTLYAKNTASTDAITDVNGPGAWATGTNVVKLVGYSVGGVAGAGNIILTNVLNALGDLYIKGATVTITENDSITDGPSVVWFGSDQGWTTTGNTTLIVANPNTKSIVLDNLSDVLGPVGISTTGTPGTLTGVTITDNSNLTQASAWTVGAAPVFVDARNHALDLSLAGNILGNIAISTVNGTPTSVSIREDDAITQGANVWSLANVATTLYAEHTHAITLTQATNVIGDLTVTGGGAVSITENDPITQGGAWSTAGVTTLNAGTREITLAHTGNILGDLAIATTTSALTITEDSDITQASAWSLIGKPITLNAQTHDVLLTQTANQLGDLTITGANATVVENHAISDGSAWVVSGLTSLTAGANAIVLDANPNSNFGTVKIISASAAEITDVDGIIFDASSVTGTLSIAAGGLITQIGAITADSLRLVGTGRATLNHASNDIANLAAGFTGGALAYTDANTFAVAVVGGTSGVNIAANNVTLTSIAGSVTGLANINASSTSLTVATGTGLTLPQITIAGPQTYTAGGSGITLSGNITSNATGVITFNSPITLSNDWVIQSTDSNINFLGTLAGATNQLTVNAGTGAIDFAAAISGMGKTTDAAVALTVSAGGSGTTFHSTIVANNGLSLTGDSVFVDDVTLADGLVGSTFGGLVTLGKSGGMTLSGFDNFSFNGGVLLQSGAATINSNSSTMTFAGANTIHGPYGLTLNSGTQTITGLDHVGADITSLVVTANTPTIPLAGIIINGSQTYTATSGTSIALNGPVKSTAAGTILFNSPVVLGADVTVTSVNSAITFAGTTDGAHDLTLSSGSGANTFTGKVGNLSALGDGVGASLTLVDAGATTFSNTVATRSGIVAAGPVTFLGNVTLGDGSVGSTFTGLVTTGGSTLSGFDGLAFNGGLSLTGATTILSNGSLLSFGNTVSGAYALTLNALAGGAGTVSGLGQIATNLTNLTVTGQTLSLPSGGLAIAGPMSFTAVGGITLNGNVGSAAAPASGQIDFTGPVTLATGAISVATANAPINFTGTVNGAQALTVNAGSAATTFTGIVGAVTPVTSLTASGLTSITGTAITTSGAQIYNNAVTLGANTTLSASALTFAGTLNGAFSLLANVSGATTFGGIVGGSSPLTSITTDSAGSVVFNTTAITTSGAQTYNELATLGANLTLNGTNLHFGSTINGGYALSLTGTGAIQLDGAAGGSTPLSSLIANGVSVAVNNVTTSGTQSYTGAVTLNGSLTTADSNVTITGATLLGADVTISTAAGAGNITFSGATSTINGAHALILSAGTGNVLLGGVVGGLNPLTTVAVSGFNLTIPVVNSSSTQTYAALNNLTLSESRTSSVPLTFTADADGDGSGTFILPTAVGLVTSNQALTINAADFDLQGTSTISTGSGLFTLTPTSARNLFLGGTDVTAMSISANELSRIITSGGLNLNTTGAGWIRVAGIAADDSLSVSGLLRLSAQGSGDVGFINSASTFNALTAQSGSGTINLGQNLTTTNDPIIFASPVATTATVAVSSGGGNISFQSTLAANNPITFTTSGGTLAFAGNVTGNSMVTITLAGGNVTGLDLFQSTLTGLTLSNNAIVSLPTISINGQQTYNGPVSITGNLSGVGIAFNNTAQIAANNLTLDSGTGILTFANTLGASTNNFTLAGDEINFANTVTGTGSVALQPSTASVDVVVGGGSSTAGLDLTAAELAWLPSNLSGLTIGRAVGSGTLSLAAATNFGTVPLTLNGGGGISQAGTLTAGTLTLRSAAGINLSNTGNVLGAITVAGSPTSVNLADSTDLTQGAAWVLGSSPVTLNAGIHAITLTQASNTFGALVLSGGTVEVTEAADTTLGASSASSLTVISTGAVSTSGTLAVSGAASFKTLDNSGKSITLGNSSTFGSVSAVSRNAADAAYSAGAISIAPGGSTLLKVLGTTGNITLTSPAAATLSQDGTSTLEAAGLELLGSGNFVLTAGNNAITTLAGNTGNVTFREDSGFAIGTVNTTGLTATGDVSLSSTGAVTQSQKLVASGLELLGAAGTFTLTDTLNAITTLAGNTGSVSFLDDSGFAIGTVNSVGLTTSGDTLLSSTGTVTQSQKIAAAGLDLSGAAGVYTLTNAGNAITTLAGNTGVVSFLENSGFAIGTVSNTGLATTGNLTLSTAGAASQTQNISTAGLELLGSGAFTFTRATNVIPVLASNTGSASVRTSGALSIGTVNTVGATTSGNLTLTAGDVISQSAALAIGGNLGLVTTHGAGDVTINNTGATATVTGNTQIGGDYLLTATGDVVSQASSTNLQVVGALTIVSGSTTLDGAGNLIGGVLNASGSGNTIRASGVIFLGTQNELGDFTVVSEAANRTFDNAANHGTAINLNSSANSVAGAISVTTATSPISTGLDVQTGVVQTGGTTLNIAGAASFTAEASSAGSLGVILNNTGNSFGQLRVSGNIVNVRNSAARTTNLASSVATTSLTLTAADLVTQSGAIITPSLNITAPAAVTLNNAGNNIASLTIDANGNIAYTDADSFAVAGLDAHTHSVSLAAGGSGDITQTGALTNVTALSLASGGAITLTNASNTINSLAGVASGAAVQLIDSAGGLSIGGAVQSTTGDITIRTTGDLTLASGSAVTATAGDIALSAEGSSNFINNSGASALTVGNGKRWLVYSKTPDLVGSVHTVKGGLTSAFRLYGKTFASDNPASIASLGNGFIYADSPSTTLTISPTIVGTASQVFGDNPTATLGYAVSSGFVDSEDTGTNIGITGTALYDLALANSLNAGVHTIHFTGGLSSSYTLVADANGVDYTVTKAPLSYVANAATRLYGDLNPSLGGTITGFKLTNDLSTLGGSVSWNTAADTSSHVGDYAITGSGYTASNYSFIQAAGNATALSVTARPLTLTADGQSRMFGNANPTTGAFSLTSGSLVNSDTLAASLTVSSPATLTSDVGNYALTPSASTFTAGAASDYAITYANGNLAVTTRPITLTADNQSRLYGNANPTTGTFAIGGSGLANSNTLASTLDVSSPAALTSDVGNYTLTPSNAVFTNGTSSNYAITYAVGSLGVTARPILITANDQSRFYGNANPLTGAFSVGGNGLANSDTLTTPVSVTSSAVATSHVGSFTLSPGAVSFSSGSSSNYIVTYADGSLLVAARPLTLTADNQSRIYGDSNPTAGTFAMSGSGLINGDLLDSSLTVSSPAGPTSNVGSYALTPSTAVFTSGTASDYAITFVNGSLGVTARPLTITADNQSRIYGNANPATGTFTVGGSGLVNSNTLVSTTAVTSSAATTDHVGSYNLTPGTVSFSNGTASNYAITYFDGSLAVTQRPVSLTANNQSRLYGDNNPSSGSFTIGGSGLASGDALTSTIAVGSPADVMSNVGSYTLTPSNATFTTGVVSDYAVTFIDGSLAVTARPITITANTQARGYGDANPTIGGFTVTGGLVNGNALGSTIAVTSPATLTSSVGDYALAPGSISFTSGLSSNYTVSYANGLLSVTPALLTYTANAGTRIYGDANPAFTGSLSGFKNSDTLGSVVTGTAVFGTNASVTDNVGSYAVAGSGLTLSNSNYTFAQAPSNATALTITPRPASVVAANDSRHYGDANPAVVGVTVNNLVNGDVMDSASVSTTATVTSNVGTYALVPTGANFSTGLASNYVVTYTNGLLEVTRRPLAVTAASLSRVYGDTTPLYGAFAADNLANGDTLGISLLTTSATATSNVGTYNLTPSTASFISGNSSNYSITYADGSLSVTARPITLTAVGQSRIYGNANPTTGIFALSGLGLVNGDAIVSTIGVSSPAALTSNVGNYALTPGSATFSSGSASNYAIAYVDGSLAVTPRALALVANNQTRLYGNANPASAGVSADNLVNGDTIGSVNVSTTATVGSSIGSYLLVPTGANFSSGSAANYSYTYTNGLLEVTPRPLLVSTVPVSRVYGDANPIFGAFSGDNLANGDTLGVSVLTTSATLLSNVGSYQLTPSTASFTSGSATNYAISYADSTLAVTARPLTVTSADQTRIYGNANPTTGSFSIGGRGLANSDAMASLVSLTSSAALTSNVGNYALTPGNATFSSGSVGNYAITYVAGNLGVTPRAISLTADNQSRVYGDANPLSGSFTTGGLGLANADTLSATVALTSPALITSNVGGYGLTPASATFTSGSASNYTISYLDGILGVIARPITVTASDRSRVYGEANPATGTFMIGGRGLANNDAMAPLVTLSSPSVLTSDVGSYALTPGGGTFSSGSSSNYAITYADSLLSVTPRPVTVAANAQTKIYGSTDPVLGYQAEAPTTGHGLLAGQSLSGALSRAAGETVAGGPYVITQGSLVSNGNYVITFVGNLFSITPAVLTYLADPSAVGDRVSFASLTGTVTGFLGGDSIANATTGAAVWSTNAVDSSMPGLYAITGSGLQAVNGNYGFVQDARNATALNVTQINSASILKPVIPTFRRTELAMGGNGSPTNPSGSEITNTNLLAESFSVQSAVFGSGKVGGWFAPSQDDDWVSLPKDAGALSF